MSCYRRIWFNVNFETTTATILHFAEKHSLKFDSACLTVNTGIERSKCLSSYGELLHRWLHFFSRPCLCKLSSNFALISSTASALNSTIRHDSCARGYSRKFMSVECFMKKLCHSRTPYKLAYGRFWSVDSVPQHGEFQSSVWLSVSWHYTGQSSNAL